VPTAGIIGNPAHYARRVKSVKALSPNPNRAFSINVMRTGIERNPLKVATFNINNINQRLDNLPAH